LVHLGPRRKRLRNYSRKVAGCTGLEGEKCNYTETGMECLFPVFSFGPCRLLTPRESPRFSRFSSDSALSRRRGGDEIGTPQQGSLAQSRGSFAVRDELKGCCRRPTLGLSAYSGVPVSQSCPFWEKHVSLCGLGLMEDRPPGCNVTVALTKIVVPACA